MEKKKIIYFLIIYMLFSIINLRFNINLLNKQLVFYLIGFILLIFFKKDYKFLFRYLYIIFNILLLYLLFFGREVNGSKSWIYISFLSFQPSEFMKIILIFYISYIIIRYDKYILKSFIITLIPAILTFLEPDTGNVIFYFVIFLILMIYKNRKSRVVKYGIFSLIILGIITSFIFYKFSNNLINIFGYSFYYRLERIFTLFNNTSYQLNRALIGMGSSYLFGNSNSISIPYQYTDFAFSYLVSNIGFVGSCVFLIFNLCFDIYLIKNISKLIGINKYILIGLISMKIFQEYVHILMNIGFFPITGITLPFISYGGSSLLTYFIVLSYLSNSNNYYSKDMVLG